MLTYFKITHLLIINISLVLCAFFSLHQGGSMQHLFYTDLTRVGSCFGYCFLILLLIL